MGRMRVWIGNSIAKENNINLFWFGLFIIFVKMVI